MHFKPSFNPLVFTPQALGDGSPPVVRGQNLDMISRFPTSTEPQVLDLAFKMEYSQYELRVVQTQLETERAARGLLEAQLQRERENTRCLFEVLRKSRNL